MFHFLPLIVPAILTAWAFIDYKRVMRRSRQRAAQVASLEAEARAYNKFKRLRRTPNIVFDSSKP